MITFSSTDDLLDEIIADKISRNINDNRYPVRFIFLPSFSHLKDITVRLVTTHNIAKIELKDILNHSDAWLTSADIEEVIEQQGDNDILLLPLSELARFYPNNLFISLFNILSEIENSSSIQSKRRIYIPLVGLYERFHNEFYRQFHRRSQWAPIYNLADSNESKIKIYISNVDLKNIPEVNMINNTEDWFNLWKSENFNQLICISDTLMYLFNNRLPDQAFDLDRINNIKELFSKQFNINVPIEYLEQDEKYWIELLTSYNKRAFTNMDELISNSFNKIEISPSDVINLWVESNDLFNKWLLRNYVISLTNWQDKYIHKIMVSTKNIDDDQLIENVWMRIFSIQGPIDKLAEERALLLSNYYNTREYNEYWIEDKISSALEKINNKSLKLKLITGIADCEKHLLIEEVLDNRDNLHILESKYRGLYYYLSEIIPSNIEEENDWIIDYFDNYRWSKVSNSLSPNITNLLNLKNNSKESFYNWYYNFQSVNSILSKMKVDKVFLIDAVGIEWLPLLVKIIERDLSLVVEEKYVARANLPTTTEMHYNIARDHYIQDFDKLIHNDIYKHPGSIIKEIDALFTIIKRKVAANMSERIAITSDHGLTALIRLADTLKMHDYSDAEHEYRCMKVGSDFEDIDDCFVHSIDEHESENKSYCLITLKYTSLYRKPIREVHGGATPEEVLVPLLIVSKASTSIRDVYSINLLQDVVGIRKPLFQISITPKPRTTPKILIDGRKQYSLEYNENTKTWEIELVNIFPGKHGVRISIENWDKFVDIIITGGMKETELL